ncbi:Spo0E family sporulation regulatory protein-aspartic acid phosphatase [Paenactinomyces guangxiensis]|uniref:Spo0E family sporulation regulatory protein-aspartic acid phosphatase n=1 Tax=Paenactinomyces guangxiensis TaxID=1490290 RepID=A0A7W1WR24_9BACL|nr:Spo0E family sporulation regulatory protein-aspartic acid phosphatase [Paenactinomyces guangxiensis]MBA4494383.1 Spo0E family sporulation regulatory protein-aspartic acid phosphatase [Paenactinomyces guangxiensis]MBH8591562.1 Spo0E family sporulation regulatory protein-aspartic acid phosphatase [Paenactinomyces guangxiensis]
MVEMLRIRRLEEELERLRTKLYQSVDGEPSRLADSRVLPLSRRLDALILEIQKEKEKFRQ